MNECYQCLICGRSETQLPLVAQRYRGQSIWVCTGCMPLVIHHPEEVRDRLEALSGGGPRKPEEG